MKRRCPEAKKHWEQIPSCFSKINRVLVLWLCIRFSTVNISYDSGLACLLYTLVYVFCLVCPMKTWVVPLTWWAFSSLQGLFVFQYLLMLETCNLRLPYITSDFSLFSCNVLGINLVCTDIWPQVNLENG